MVSSFERCHLRSLFLPVLFFLDPQVLLSLRSGVHRQVRCAAGLSPTLTALPAPPQPVGNVQHLWQQQGTPQHLAAECTGVVAKVRGLKEARAHVLLRGMYTAM
jgi:hypothetical protein